LIRRLAPTEWELLRDVRLASLTDAPTAFASTHAREAAFGEATWRERLAGNAWYVGTDPGSGPELVTGIVAGRHDPSSPPDQRHLIAMWVAPSARGTGLAVDLVEAVARWARADGATELTLGVTAGNDRASGLYLKCGFVATGETFLLDNDPSRPYHLFSRSLDPATS